MLSMDNTVFVSTFEAYSYGVCTIEREGSIIFVVVAMIMIIFIVITIIITYIATSGDFNKFEVGYSIQNTPEFSDP